jgi:hypothetical protein
LPGIISNPGPTTKPTTEEMTMAKVIETKIENGKLIVTVAGYPEFVFDPAKLNPEILLHATLHGGKQKLVDSASLPNGATIAEKYAAIKETFDRITAPDGTWNKGGNGDGSQPSGLLFRALCRLYPDKPTDKLKEWLDAQDKQKQAALRKNPKIAAIIETIKAESAKDGGINSDDLLSDLDLV